MKTQEELNALKKEVETVNRKLEELTEEELSQVTGGTFDGNVKTFNWETAWGAGPEGYDCSGLIT